MEVGGRRAVRLTAHKGTSHGPLPHRSTAKPISSLVALHCYCLILPFALLLAPYSQVTLNSSPLAAVFPSLWLCPQPMHPLSG